MQMPHQTSNDSESHDPPLRYYEGPELTESVLAAIKAGGRSVDRIDSDDLAGLDEFHALGRPATLALARLAEIGTGERVLDIGAGIGGPGRALARHFGALVTALDPTQRFCELNRVLCERTGLAELITVVEGDARSMPFADESFDIAWTQAVWQNLEDKRRVAEEIHRVVRPGGRLALFEVGAGPGGELHFPVPWADDATQSFLVGPGEMRVLLADAGFDELCWQEGSGIQASIQQAASQGHGMATGAPGLTLELLMPDFEARMAGLARNVQDQRIVLIQAVMRRP